jgi:hypothetical protein
VLLTWQAIHNYVKGVVLIGLAEILQQQQQQQPAATQKQTALHRTVCYHSSSTFCIPVLLGCTKLQL